ncbi:hypothetical protein ScPMuIL_018816 [Solemya velum]
MCAHAYIGSIILMESQITLIFFAKSQELSGLKDSQLSVPQSVSYSQLLSLILQAFPRLEPISENLILSLNEDYISVEEEVITLQTGDEVGVIPPISGG